MMQCIKLGTALIAGIFLTLAPASAHELYQRPLDVSRFTPETIQFVSEQQAYELNRLKLRSVSHPVFQERAQAALTRLVEATYNWPLLAGLDLSVHVTDQAHIGAFVGMNGKIYITRATLEKWPSEEGLAAVLAHEMAHVARRHTYQNVEWYLDSGGKSANASSFDLARSAFLVFQLRSKKREFEYEADHMALEILDNAKIDPREFPKMLVELDPAQESESVLVRTIERACNTHPATCLRVESAFKEIEIHDYKMARSTPRSSALAEWMRVFKNVIRR